MLQIKFSQRSNSYSLVRKGAVEQNCTLQHSFSSPLFQSAPISEEVDVLLVKFANTLLNCEHTFRLERHPADVLDFILMELEH